MNPDQCPYCGTDVQEQERCPACGRDLSDAALNDPFASAMAQERHSREQQASMREKYRVELPDPPPKVQPEATAFTAMTGQETGPDAETTAAAPQQKKASVLPSVLIFAGLLLLICGGVYFFSDMQHVRPPKNTSYVFYRKDNDLWFYSGKKRKPICIAEGVLSELNNSDPESYESYLAASLCNKATYYDAEQNLVWYPTEFEYNRDPEKPDYMLSLASCRLICKNLRNGEEKIAAEKLALDGWNPYKGYSMSVNYGVLSQMLPVDEYADIRPPYVFIGKNMYYIDTHHRLICTDGTDSEAVAKFVCRFWAAEDGQSVMFISSDPNAADLEGFGADFDPEDYISSTETTNVVFESSDKQFSIYQVRNGETPKLICDQMNTWSIPQTASSRYVLYSADIDGTLTFRRYDTVSGDEKILLTREDEDDDASAAFSLCCYPNGDCYFAGSAFKWNHHGTYLSIEDALKGGDASYVKEADDGEGYIVYNNRLYDPLITSFGVWFYDSEKDTSTQLFSPKGYAERYDCCGACCRTKPYIVGVSAFGVSCYYRDQEMENANLPLQTDDACFSNDGRYILCGYADYASSTTPGYKLKLGEITEDNAVLSYDELDTSDGFPMFYWYKEPETNEEIPLILTYQYSDNPQPGEVGIEDVSLAVGSRVLKNCSIGFNGCNRFGQAYVLTGIDAEAYYSNPSAIPGGTLNRLDKDGWTAVAWDVKQYLEPSEDALYLICGKTTDTLNYLTNNKLYMLDSDVDSILCSDSVPDPES